MSLKRIIIHWTAGGHKPSSLDLSHYHYVIAGDGSIHSGKFKPEDNIKPVSGKYAAHTLNCNTGSIGVSLAAMAGAVERPFNVGKSPITKAQEDALTNLLVKLCDEYGITLSPETVLTHAEVQPTLGIKQKGKWDITWLPGMTQPGEPVTIGNVIRERVRVARRTAPSAGPKKESLLSIILKLLGLKK